MAFVKEKTVTVTAEDFVNSGALGWAELSRDGKAYLFQIMRDDSIGCPREEYEHQWTWTTTDGAGYTDKGAIPVDDFREMEQAERAKYVIVPLYLYRHSGDYIGMSNAAYPFNDRFDAGCMGLAYVEREWIRREYGWKVLTRKRMEKLKTYLRHEVDEMNAWMQGDVYGFSVMELASEEEDSCWGFFCPAQEDLLEAGCSFLEGWFGKADYTDVVREAADRI
jgi:hypothetical protein